jgi:hypothetical protein
MVGENVALPAWYLNVFWLLPHLEQITIAVIMFVLSWFLLRNTEINSGKFFLRGLEKWEAPVNIRR